MANILKEIGKWLMSAVYDGDDRPQLAGFFHEDYFGDEDKSRWLIASDGKRMHAVRHIDGGSADLSCGDKKIRCPYTGAIATGYDEPPDYKLVFSRVPEEIVVTIDGKKLFAAVSGAMKAAKSINKRINAVVQFLPRDVKVTVSVNMDELDSGIVIRQCSYMEGERAKTCIVDMGFLEEALSGFYKVNGDCQIQIKTGYDDFSPMFLRLPPIGDEEFEMVAMLMPMTECEDSNKHVQRVNELLIKGGDKKNKTQQEKLNFDGDDE